MCTHTDTHVLTFSHVTHASVRTHMHMFTHRDSCMHRHPRTRVRTHTHKHTRVHAHTTHMHTCAHIYPHSRTCVHTLTPAHTQCQLLQTLTLNHCQEEHDVSESLLTLLPLLRPCSPPDRDVIRRGRPPPGQYFKLQSLALLHVSSC